MSQPGVSGMTTDLMLRARISRSALALGAARAVEAGGRGGVADLRRDAWGHGLLAAAQAVIAAGARAVRVDGRAEVDALRFEGIGASIDAEPDLDSRLLYGLPAEDGTPTGRPVMRLVGRVMSTKPIAAGGGVSYGYLHRAAHDSRLALVSGGYAQGIVRALGSRAEVGVAGTRRPIVGRIAMDVCVVDIGDLDVSVGDEAVFFGGDGPMTTELVEWSRITGMTVPELVAVVGQRAERAWEA